MKQQTSCATETHTKSSKTIDYTGKTIHVGIDVHLKDWQIATINETVVLGNHRMEGRVENVVAHLQKRFPGAIFKCVYESCDWEFELQRQLVAKVWNVLSFMRLMYQVATRSKREKPIR